MSTPVYRWPTASMLAAETQYSCPTFGQPSTHRCRGLMLAKKLWEQPYQGPPYWTQSASARRQTKLWLMRQAPATVVEPRCHVS